MRCADLGCGWDARLGRVLAGAGAAEVVLVDISVSPDLASRGPFTRVEGVLPHVLEGLEGGFDVVAAVNVVEHLDEDQTMLNLCHDLLVPGGRLVVNVPSWLGKSALEISAFRLGLSPAEEMNDHRRYYDPRDLWPLLVKAGFRPQDIRCRRHKFGLNTFAVCRRRT